MLHSLYLRLEGSIILWSNIRRNFDFLPSLIMGESICHFGQNELNDYAALSDPQFFDNIPYLTLT